MDHQQVTLSTPTDVITAVAWLLGFHPTDSLIVMTFNGGSAPIMRVNFPHTGDALIETATALGVAYRKNPGGKALIVAQTSDPVAGFDAITAVTGMLDGLVDVEQGLIVDGDRWLSTGGGAGTLDPARVRLVEAEMVAIGRTPPKPSRDALASDLAPIDPAPIENARADVPLDRLTPAWVTARIEEFRIDGLTLNDDDAAAVLLALTHNEVFDDVTLLATLSNAHAHIALYSDLIRRAPGDLQGNVAALLALSAWLSGDGALAWTAVEHSNKRTLTLIVADLLTAAVSPTAWDTIRQSIADD